PFGIAVGPDGSVYFTDALSTIRRITPDGIIHRFAGMYQSSNAQHVLDGQPATSGTLAEPWGITVAPDGTVLVGELRTPNLVRGSEGLEPDANCPGRGWRNGRCIRERPP